MYKSILQFNESGTIRLDNICADFFENPNDVASFVNNVKEEALRFACAFIGHAFEELNGLIKSSSSRKKQLGSCKKRLEEHADFYRRNQLYKDSLQE